MLRRPAVTPVADRTLRAPVAAFARLSECPSSVIAVLPLRSPPFISDLGTRKSESAKKRRKNDPGAY